MLFTNPEEENNLKIAHDYHFVFSRKISRFYHSFMKVASKTKTKTNFLLEDVEVTRKKRLKENNTNNRRSLSRHNLFCLFFEIVTCDTNNFAHLCADTS